MKLVKEEISLKELKKLAKEEFGNLVKAVVDIEQEVMVVDAELHADQEALLIKDHGSKQENLWGINIYPEAGKDDFIEFDSMINLRPSFGNSSRGVDDLETRKRIKEVVNNLVTK
jgi:hypothetical protein